MTDDQFSDEMKLEARSSAIFQKFLSAARADLEIIALQMRNNGWIDCYLWDEDSTGNPLNLIPSFTEKGIANFRVIHLAWKNSGLENLAEMEPKNIPFICELGVPMTKRNLGALHILAAMCIASHGKGQ